MMAHVRRSEDSLAGVTGTGVEVTWQLWGSDSTCVGAKGQLQGVKQHMCEGQRVVLEL